MSDQTFTFIENFRGDVTYLGEHEPQTGEILYWVPTHETRSREIHVVVACNSGTRYDSGKAGKNYIALRDLGRAAFDPRKALLLPETATKNLDFMNTSLTGTCYLIPRSKTSDAMAWSAAGIQEERDVARTARQNLEESLKRVFGDLFSGKKA